MASKGITSITDSVGSFIGSKHTDKDDNCDSDGGANAEKYGNRDMFDTSGDTRFKGKPIMGYKYCTFCFLMIIILIVSMAWDEYEYQHKDDPVVDETVAEGSAAEGEDTNDTGNEDE